MPIPKGEIFGILGPNGAGNTTTVECLSGLRVPDGGTIRVLGLDPQQDRAALREWVGVQLQEGSLRAKLTVGELVDLFASFYAFLVVAAIASSVAEVTRARTRDAQERPP
jgi:ABC-2 type transport system ATP-binding protein